MTRKYQYKGEFKTLREWSAKTGISYQSLYNRLFTYNWPIEKALTRPTKVYKRKNE